MTDTSTDGLGVRGNTPADDQRAQQQQRTQERNTAKVEIPIPWVRTAAWVTLTVLLIYLTNVYEWTFSWTIIVSTIALVGAWKLKQNVVSKSESHYKAVMGETLNATMVVAAATIAITLLTASFTVRLADAVDDIEECVGGDVTACDDLQFNRRQASRPRHSSTVPYLEWQTVTAPADRWERVHVGLNFFCPGSTTEARNYDITYHELRTPEAHALIQSRTGEDVRVPYLRGPREAVAERAPWCVEPARQVN